MLKIDGLKFEQQSGQLFIHFDVADHFLKLDTFIQTADNAKRVINALDEAFFDGDLDYELIVLPPESGTFLTKLALYVGSGVGAVFAFINTDVGGAYVEGLTGHEPSYWAKIIGEHHRDNLKEIKESADVEVVELESQVIEECQISAIIVTEMARGILERETDELAQVGINATNMPDVIEARNEFFEACIADPDVQGIGFSRDDDFPIPRSSFPERAIKGTRKEEEEDTEPWEVVIETIYVTSPNWDKGDQKFRKWKGKDSVRRDCYFTIEDDEFWEHVRDKDLHVNVLDQLKVQWALQRIEGKIKDRRVLRVLEFNNEKLAEPLSEDALHTMLGEISGQTQYPNPDLFSE